ncbi:MAG: endolytic transglycosylase MltG [bacterium]|nr:endolytic transglycosylase MltG [bacterium]
MKRYKKTKQKSYKKHLIVTPILAGIMLMLFVVVYYKIDPALLAEISFYQDLANPNIKIIKIQEGLRKEQVVETIAKKLEWTEVEKQNFLNAHLALEDTNELEGKYFPKTYLINKDAKPTEVSGTIIQEFNKQIEKVKKAKTKEIINEDTAIKIASIIQREAGGKKDRYIISGIIWNRFWLGMKLQMDATLQYAKGSEEEGWWQKVHPDDKYIDSPYNTYLHKGLPPGPIANPGLEAIKAAYNPAKTDCLFYLHDRKGRFHCSKDYAGHKKNIELYY